MVCVHNFVSMLAQTLIFGIIIAKIGCNYAPSKQHAIVFARNCCIGHRENKLCLMIRVVNISSRPFISPNIHVRVNDNKNSYELNSLQFLYHPPNERELLKTKELELNDQLGDTDIQSWPVILCHIIDDTSAMKKYVIDDMEGEMEMLYEIHVTITGVDGNTGKTIIAWCSYLQHEIMFSHR